MSSSKLRDNIFELQALEVRRLLTTASVDSNHILQVLGTSGNDAITVNKNSSGKLTVTGVTATFSIGSASGQANAINIQASGGNDVVLITSNVKNGTVGIPATIAGNSGNDSLTGGPGNDVLSGGDGNDTLDGGIGSDVMTGGAGTDTSNYSNRTDNLVITMGNAGSPDGDPALGEKDDVETEECIGGSGNDSITGSSLQDFIAGGAGADSLNGGDGNDQLTSSSGSSQLFGQNGDDALYAQNGHKDTVNGGTNSDGTTDFDTALVDSIDVGSITSNQPTTNSSSQPAQGSDLDPTYGVNGKTLAQDLGWDFVNGSAIDSQGRVYFVGSIGENTGNGYGSDVAVARFDANGNLDTTYTGGGNVSGAPAGQVRIDFTAVDGPGSGYGSNNGDDFARGIVIAPGDKVLVLGSHNPVDGTLSEQAVARLMPDGSLDTTFGLPDGQNAHSGITVFALQGSAGFGYGNEAIDAAVQSDGKIDVAGNYDDGQGGDFAITRLLADGSFDDSTADPTGNFNDVGYATFDIDNLSSDNLTSIALQTLSGDNGAQRVVLGGNSDGQFALVRFNADGTVDNSFGDSGDGVVLNDFGGTNSLNDLAVNSLNQIVAVGDVSSASQVIGGINTPITSVQPGQQDAILAVYAPTGQGAPSTVDQPPTIGDFASFDTVAIDSQNRIVVAGEQNNDIIVGRYTPSLSTDTTFANGFATLDFSPDSTQFNQNDFPLAVSVLSSKAIVVSGITLQDNELAEEVAARFVGDVNNVPPGTNEGDVEQVENFIDYNSLHQVPPPPFIAALLNELSPAARLYVLSKPDNQGVARIDLTDASDNVTIGTVVAADGTTNVVVTVNGVAMYYDAATTTQIQIYGNGGNDSIIASPNVPVPLLIDGGAGNDIIVGGANNDLLFGGPGLNAIDGNGGADVIVGGPNSDALYGDSGNDIVIGGGGADLMAGGAGDDIEIAGTTSYDTNIAALQALSAEWSSANPNALRVAHIKGTTPGGLNGLYVLKVGTGATVFDDGVIDVLTNDPGIDWFFYRNTGSMFQRDQVLFGTAGENVSLL